MTRVPKLDAQIHKIKFLMSERGDKVTFQCEGCVAQYTIEVLYPSKIKIILILPTARSVHYWMGK